MDRRRSKRYGLRASVLFTWVDSAGIEHRCAGVTLNISPVGVFVLCDETAPPVHIFGTMEVTLPPVQEGAQGLHLKSDAQIVRLEETLGHFAFASATDFQLGEDTYTPTVQ